MDTTQEFRLLVTIDFVLMFGRRHLTHRMYDILCITLIVVIFIVVVIVIVTIIFIIVIVVLFIFGCKWRTIIPIKYGNYPTRVKSL